MGLWEEFLELLPAQHREQATTTHAGASGPIMFRAMAQAIENRLEGNAPPVLAAGVAVFAGQCVQEACTNAGQPVHVRRALDQAGPLVGKTEIFCAACGEPYDFAAVPS